ncbi:LPXTG cell wall anchor domain-containing protein [Christensenellaceae bacterium OttesenSCG-928-M15]|nr:LPXTG cell wall anchor domain-containing protein [Christensenellaceae bacterium OttesenSCG-928-M15]
MENAPLYSSGGGYSGPARYTITASAGMGGSVDPSGVISVMAGGKQTFTVYPDTGCEISKVLVNGAPVKVDANNSFTVSNVMKKTSVEVTFISAIAVPNDVVIEPPKTGDAQQGIGIALIITAIVAFGWMRYKRTV